MDDPTHRSTSSVPPSPSPSPPSPPSLIQIDGPAHGHNPPAPARFTLQDCVGVAVDVMDHLGIQEPVDWLGNAWGGHVGVCSPPPTRPRPQSDRHRRPDPRPQPRRPAPGPAAAVAVPARRPGPTPGQPTGRRPAGAAGQGRGPRGGGMVADAFRRADRRGMAAAIGWLSLARPDLTPVLDRLQIPSLLTTGEHDPMWTVDSARAAAAHLANGALVILPGAGHVGPLLQAAPAVVELVGAFWSDSAATIARFRAAPAPTSRPPVA